jgi:hypothetical protein
MHEISMQPNPHYHTLPNVVKNQVGKREKQRKRIEDKQHRKLSVCCLGKLYLNINTCNLFSTCKQEAIKLFIALLIHSLTLTQG